MKADKLINADNRTVSKLLNHEKYRGFLNPYYQWSLSILKGYTLYDVKDMASRKRKKYWKNRWKMNHWRTGESRQWKRSSALDGHIIVLMVEMMEYTRLSPMKTVTLNKTFVSVHVWMLTIVCGNNGGVCLPLIGCERTVFVSSVQVGCPYDIDLPRKHSTT